MIYMQQYPKSFTTAQYKAMIARLKLLPLGLGKPITQINHTYRLLIKILYFHFINLPKEKFSSKNPIR